MDFIISALFVILLVGGVIIVHELGHYLVARWMGIHVVEFSIGFGPRLKVWRGKKKHPHLPPTEYSLAALPFGGFVKMLGYDPTDKVPEGADDVAFGKKPVWRRFLVMVAGPAFNLILPIILFFSVSLTVSTVSPSVVADAGTGYPAAAAGMRAGDRIVEIEGEAIDYWWQLNDALDDRYDQPTHVVWVDVAGARHEATITPRREEKVIIPGVYSYPEGKIGITPSSALPIVAVVRGSPAERAGIAGWDKILEVEGEPVVQAKSMLALIAAGAERDVKVRFVHYSDVATGTPFAVAAGELREAVLPAVKPGEDPYRGLFPSDRAVWTTVPGSPAAELGLKKGDELVSIDGRVWDSWTFARAYIESRRGEGKPPIELVVRRDGQVLPTMKLAQREMDAPHELDRTHREWVHGIVLQTDTTETPHVPNEARLSYAWNQTITSFGGALENIVKTLGGLFTGDVSLKDGLSGPVQIANIAAQASEMGWAWFLKIMAMISISIGIVNLLPLPILDGGQILFLALEGIRRKPVSMRTRMIAVYASLAFIIVLMAIVIRNDVLKIS